MTRVTRTTLVLLSLVLIGLLAFSCGSDKGGGPVEPGPFNIMHLDLYDVDALSAGYVYQAWGADIDTTTTMAASVGTWHKIAAFFAVPSGSGTASLFTMDNQPITDNDITGITGNLDDYDTILVTIEPVGAIPSTPSGSAYLSGRIPADLEKSTIAGLAFPADVRIGNSWFIYATPTDNNPDNDTSGIWFLKPSLPQQPDLGLDDAPAGWKYEGWAMHAGKWLSTGKFTSPDGADESNQYSGTDNPAPPFPGEDFLMGDPSLPWVFGIGDSVAVTLEPSPDDSGDRFSIWLFHAGVIDTPALGIENALTKGGDSFPEGNAVFKRAE